MLGFSVTPVPLKYWAYEDLKFPLAATVADGVQVVVAVVTPATNVVAVLLVVETVIAVVEVVSMVIEVT